MTIYCKAYRLGDLRNFADWPKLASEHEKELEGETVVYITEHYRVCEDCLNLDDSQSFLLKEPTEAWQRYCREKLNFEMPEW